VKRTFQSGAASIQERVSSQDRVSQSPYLSSAEAADLLRFASVKQFHRWLCSNRLPKLRCGGRVLFERRVIDAYLRGELTLHKAVPVARLVHSRIVNGHEATVKSPMGTKGGR
jgi:prophage antirepressor-like protein